MAVQKMPSGGSAKEAAALLANGLMEMGNGCLRVWSTRGKTTKSD